MPNKPNVPNQGLTKRRIVHLPPFDVSIRCFGKPIDPGERRGHAQNAPATETSPPPGRYEATGAMPPARDACEDCAGAVWSPCVSPATKSHVATPVATTATPKPMSAPSKRPL